MNDRIYYRSWTGSWSGWTTLPGATANRTSAAVLGGNLHIVVNGLDGNMYHGCVNLTTSSFSGWTRLPGATPSAPTLTSNGTHLYLVVQGMNDRIYYNTWNGASWGAWTALPTGSTGDTPATTIIGCKLHIVVRGMDGTSLWHSCVDLSTDGFSGWTRLSGETPSAPTLTGYACMRITAVHSWLLCLCSFSNNLSTFLTSNRLKDMEYFIDWN